MTQKKTERNPVSRIFTETRAAPSLFPKIVGTKSERLSGLHTRTREMDHPSTPDGPAEPKKKKKGGVVHHVPPAYPPPEAPTPTQRTTPTPTEREIAYRKAVSMDIVDLDVVHALAFQGVPDAADLRPLFWKLLLGYLPPDRGQWAETLAAKRSRYQAIKQYATRLDGPRPEPEDGAADAEPQPEPEDVDGTRYVSKERAWRTYYRYDASLEVIEKDVARTLPALHFFGDEEAGGNAHGDALRSILFVYSRTNAAIKYVQGMNEILAPIYYVFAHDPGVSGLFCTFVFMTCD